MPELEPFGPIGIISHTANIDFAKAVSDVLSQKRQTYYDKGTYAYVDAPGYLRSNYILDTNLIRFQTGEGKIQFQDSVRGHDIFIITDVLAHNETMSISGYDHTFSPDDHYRDLLRIIAACRRMCRRLTVIMPFVYEGRTEVRHVRNQSLDCAQMLQELNEYGVSNIVIFDPHDPRIANAVPLMSIDYPNSAYKIISTLLRSFDTLKVDKEATMVVSPDETGVTRGIYYSSLMNLPLGLFYRERDYSVTVDGANPITGYRFLGDDVSGKDILIVDDMINSGSTMLRTAKTLKDAGAGDIYCLSPFGLFTDGPQEFDKAFEDGIIKAVLCTNLNYHSEEILARDWFVDVNMVPYIAKIIDTINTNQSLFDLINSTSRITDFLGQIRLGEIGDENIYS